MCSELKRKRVRPAAAQGGFTLLEIAVVIAVIGIIMGGAVVSISQLIKAEKINETRHKIDFVMNALSAYAQTHYRLPCPADPGAAANDIGKEGNGGNCLVAADNSGLYWQTEGIVPWKELGIPQSMVMDGWKRYITYKPAPNLTANMLSAQMQDTAGTQPLDVNNACRTSMWFDARANHVNRAKALFCCNAEPTAAYMDSLAAGSAMPANWRKSGVVTTTTAQATADSSSASLPDATPVVGTNNWTAPSGDGTLNGSFAIPNRGNADVPLLRSSGVAVTLISHGGNGNLAFLPGRNKTAREGGTVDSAGGVTGDGIAVSEGKNVWPPQMFAAVLGHPKTNDGSYDIMGNLTGASDDIVAYQRTDQVFAKVGSGSCELPPSAAANTYTCKKISFTDLVDKIKDPNNEMKDPNSRNEIDVPDFYGLQLKLKGLKYKLEANFVQQRDQAGYHNSLGFYVIGKDGSIQSVSMVETNVNNANLSANDTKILPTTKADIADDVLGVGVFIVSNGDNHNDFSKMDFVTGDKSNLKFVTNYNQSNEETAKISSETPATLVYVDPVTGVETPIRGQDGSEAYHMYSNLNENKVNRTLRSDYVCHYKGEMVGPNKDMKCKGPTAVQNPGVDPKDTTLMTVGFEDLPTINCYETTDGDCKLGTPEDPLPEDKLWKDEQGGYIANIGDNDYDDVAFSFRMQACPEGN